MGAKSAHQDLLSWQSWFQDRRQVARRDWGNSIGSSKGNACAVGKSRPGGFA